MWCGDAWRGVETLKQGAFEGVTRRQEPHSNGGALHQRKGLADGRDHEVPLGPLDVGGSTRDGGLGGGVFGGQFYC